MNALRLSWAGMIVLVATAQIGADEKAEKPEYAKLLVGKWEVTKSEKVELVGVVMEFSKDGKFKATRKKDGKEESHDGLYKVEDDKLRVDSDGPIIIKKISEKELILDGGDRVARCELKRIP